jgi:hypothetical protein
MDIEARLKQAGPYKKANPDRVSNLEAQVEGLTSQLELILGLIKANNDKTLEVEGNLSKLVDYITG